MKWNNYPVVLEIHTEVWFEKLKRKYNRNVSFMDVPDEEINKLKNLNIDAIWFMGIWKKSDRSKDIAQRTPYLLDFGKKYFTDFNSSDDIIASAYSVAEYKIGDNFGGNNSFLTFREKIKPVNIILDFVPNHTSTDHRWVSEKPELYVQLDFHTLERNTSFLIDNHVIAMGKDPNFSPWTDTAQLDYSKRETRENMISVLKEISTLCDGVRCDMAMLVTNSVFSRTWSKHIECEEEFWVKAIEEVKSYNENFIFIAEVYWDFEWELQQQGFDYTYDKTLYDRLKNRNNQGVYGHLHAEKVYYQHLVRFLENHDEERASSIWMNGSLFTSAALTLLLPGMKLIYEGQMKGEKIQYPIQFKRWVDKPLDENTYNFYKNLLKIIKKEIFHNGSWRIICTYSHNEKDFCGVFVYHWKYISENILILINNTEFEKKGYIPLDFLHWKDLKICFRDILSDDVFERDVDNLKETGWFFDLEPYEIRIYEIQPKRSIS